jgi:hypothetical protein
VGFDASRGTTLHCKAIGAIAIRLGMEGQLATGLFRVIGLRL